MGPVACVPKWVKILIVGARRAGEEIRLLARGVVALVYATDIALFDFCGHGFHVPRVS